MVQLARGFLNQVQGIGLKDSVYGVEIQTRLLSSEELGDDTRWFFSLTNSAILQTLHVYDCPWYVGITDGTLIYSSSRPPVLPLSVIPYIQPKPEQALVLQPSSDDEDAPPTIPEEFYPTLKAPLTKGNSNKASVLAQKRTEEPHVFEEVEAEELEELQRKAVEYEEQMKSYEDELQKLKQCLNARDRELRTLKLLLDDKSQVVARLQQLGSDQPIVSEPVEDMVFWKNPERRSSAEQGKSFLDKSRLSSLKNISYAQQKTMRSRRTHSDVLQKGQQPKVAGKSSARLLSQGVTYKILSEQRSRYLASPSGNLSPGHPERTYSGISRRLKRLSSHVSSYGRGSKLSPIQYNHIKR